MLWIKEVELVESVDDLQCSCIYQRNSNGPDFELLDARIASALKNHPEYPLQEKGQSGGNEKPKKKTVSFEEDTLLT